MEAYKSLVIIDVTHNLESLAITFQVVEYEVLSLGSDVGDSAGQ